MGRQSFSLSLSLSLLNTKVSKQIADDVSRGKWNEEESRRNRDTHTHTHTHTPPSVHPSASVLGAKRGGQKSPNGMGVHVICQR